MGEKSELSISKGLRKEILRIIILNNLGRHSGYPYQLLKAIESRKVFIFEGLTKSDLYNAIASLEKQGFIKSKAVMKGAKVQKHFDLTAKGKKIVIASRKAMVKTFLAVNKLMKDELNG
ncbi:MAG: helix-turn-helix transcriptional regulator [Candidatus Micrarchaeota archaeon]|nr:helix-turn-helix transcriptional regulator [Candidatus Micrarchaeota archaeon]MDE1805018.1 helix-turn-helix transcriptional regulator [Candidatus Micrarchaeota archaeon]